MFIDDNKALKTIKKQIGKRKYFVQMCAVFNILYIMCNMGQFSGDQEDVYPRQMIQRGMETTKLGLNLEGDVNSYK